jgi:hypothetical protein
MIDYDLAVPIVLIEIDIWCYPAAWVKLQLYNIATSLDANNIANQSTPVDLARAPR